MKAIILFLLLTISAHSETYAQSQFKLEPSQTMLMTGKGEGQDAAKNSCAGKDCVAIVQNLEESEFSIRIQQNGELIKIIPVDGKESKKVLLLKGQELYIDSNPSNEINFDLTFENSNNFIDG